MAKPFKILLAASGGGHLRQLLDLESVWAAHDHVFVTTDFALGRSVAQVHRVHFVTEYGFGMWHQHKRIVMLWRSARNCCEALALVFRERPQLVITTGAAAIFWSILLARLTGARLVSIESFARMEAPSVYGKLVRRFADHLVVQSPKLKAYWPEAEVFDPLRIFEKPRPHKESLALVTVGALTSFDRMVGAVVALKRAGGLPERVIIQTGKNSAFTAETLHDLGSEIECVEALDFATIQDILKRAELVICHGGTGSIITALREGCRVLAMPRSFEREEAFDDHQEEIINSFAARGLLEAVYDEADLEAAIARARARTPIFATTEPEALRAYLRRIIADMTATAPNGELLGKHRYAGMDDQRQQREA